MVAGSLWQEPYGRYSWKNPAHSIEAESCSAPTYSHVRLAASIHCLCHRVHQVATDAKVAHLHMPLLVDEDVGRLHIYKWRIPFSAYAE